MISATQNNFHAKIVGHNLCSGYSLSVRPRTIVSGSIYRAAHNTSISVNLNMKLAIVGLYTLWVLPMATCNS